MSDLVDDSALRRLFDVGGNLVAQRDPGAVFNWILAAARELTGARYAALGVLNEQCNGLEYFHAVGVDDETHRAIGDPPRGRGVLGVLVLERQSLRLDDVTAHPGSYGFPTHHPVMRSFLGVPISIRREVWGSLYLAEKDAGAFTETDEEIAVVLAGWAATAVDMTRVQLSGEHDGAWS
jgi:GAF domain-containing protein